MLLIEIAWPAADNALLVLARLPTVSPAPLSTTNPQPTNALSVTLLSAINALALLIQSVWPVRSVNSQYKALPRSV